MSLNHNKKITIANVPLNGTTLISSPNTTDNASRTVVYNQEENSIEFSEEGILTNTLFGWASNRIGTIDFAELNALPTDPTVDKLFTGVIPENSVPEAIVAVIDTPFAFASGTTQLSLNTSIDNNGTSIALKGAIAWSVLGLQLSGAKSFNFLNVNNYLASTLAGDLTAQISFKDGGFPVDNPQNLSAGKVVLYAVSRNINGNITA